MLYKEAAKWLRRVLASKPSAEKLDKALQLRAAWLSRGSRFDTSSWNGIDRYFLGGKIDPNETWSNVLKRVKSRAKVDDLTAKLRGLYTDASRPSFKEAYAGLRQTAATYNGQKSTYKAFRDAMKRDYGLDIMSWQDLRKAVGTNRPLAHGHRGSRSYEDWLGSLGRNELGWYSPNVSVSTGYALHNQAPLSVMSHPGLSNKKLKRLSHAHVADPSAPKDFIRRQHAKFRPHDIESSKNYELELSPDQRRQFMRQGNIVDVWPFGSMSNRDAGHGFSRSNLDNVGFARFDGSLQDSRRVKRALNKWSDDIDADIWGPQGWKYRVPWKQWL